MVKTVVVSASVTLHAAAITALFVAALWRMEKIPLEDRSAIHQPFVLPSAAPAGGPPKKIELKAAVRVTPKETVQPTPPDQTPTQAVAQASAATSTADSGTGGPGGDGTNPDPNAPKDTTGTCVGDACGTDTTTPPVKKVEPPKKDPVTVTPRIATALRTSGNEQIHAPDSVRVQMRHAGKERLTGIYHLCISARGDVTSARTLRTTGYDAYDDEILSTMRTWRYRPYAVNGEAQPFCYAVTIVYVMR